MEVGGLDKEHGEEEGVLRTSTSVDNKQMSNKANEILKLQNKYATPEIIYRPDQVLEFGTNGCMRHTSTTQGKHKV